MLPGLVVQSPISTNPGLTLYKTDGVNPEFALHVNRALNNRPLVIQMRNNNCTPNY